MGKGQSFEIALFFGDNSLKDGRENYRYLQNYALLSSTISKYSEVASVITVCALIVVIPVASYLGTRFFGNSAVFVDIALRPICMFLLLMVLISLPFRKFHLSNESPASIIQFIAIFALAVFGIISVQFSINKPFSLYGAPYRYEGVWSLLSYYTLFITAAFTGKRYHRIIFLFILISGIIQGLYALMQHYNGYFPWVYSMYDATVSGFVGNPNYFGTLIAMLTCLSMAGFCFVEKRFEKAILLIVSNFFFTLSIFSNTTSSWVGIFFAYCILGFFVIRVFRRRSKEVYRVHRNQIIQNWIFIGLSFAAIFFLFNAFEDWIYLHGLIDVSSEASDIVKSGEISDQMGSFRGYIWKTCLAYLPQYWLHGCGIDALYTLDIRIPFDTSIHVDKAHNEFLQIAITQGVPALFSYIILVGTTLWLGFRKVIQENTINNSWLLVAFIVAFTGYLAQSFFNNSVINVAPYFWLIGGLICAQSYK